MKITEHKAMPDRRTPSGRHAGYWFAYSPR